MRQAAEFVQTFNLICPPEAKRGQKIHLLAVTSRCRNLTFRKWSVFKLGHCQNTLENRIGRRDKLVALSRERFATPRAVIEDKLKRWMMDSKCTETNETLKGGVREFVW